MPHFKQHKSTAPDNIQQAIPMANNENMAVVEDVNTADNNDNNITNASTRSSNGNDFSEDDEEDYNSAPESYEDGKIYDRDGPELDEEDEDAEDEDDDDEEAEEDEDGTVQNKPNSSSDTQNNTQPSSVQPEQPTQQRNTKDQAIDDAAKRQQLNQVQQIQQLQQQQMQQGHAQAQAQAQGQLQVNAQAQNQQNLLFYSQLLSQQGYPNQKENPLFTLANSVPSNNNADTTNTINTAADQDSNGANYFMQKNNNNTGKSEEIDTKSNQSQSSTNANNTNNLKISRGSLPNADWLTPMGLPMNMAANLTTAIANQAANVGAASTTDDQSNLAIPNAATLSQMLQYNQLGNAYQLGIINSNGNNGSGVDLSIQTPGQQSDIILDPASHQNLLRSSISGFQQVQAQHPRNDINSPKVFVCHHPGCHKTFSRKLNYLSHFQSKHEHKKPFECDICHKQFARHSDCHRHEKSQHNDKKAYRCGGILDNGIKWGCGKRFKRKDGLTAHWKSLKAKRRCFENLTQEGITVIEKNLTTEQ